MKAPRLKSSDHVISSMLIKAMATPLAMLLTTISIFGYVLWIRYGNGTFDELWGLPKLVLIIGAGSLLLSLLDLISNAYQEVSADDRHADVLANQRAGLEHQEKMIAMLERLESDKPKG